MPYVLYDMNMKTVAFRLPEHLMAAIDAEARERRVSRSDVVRECLTTYVTSTVSRSTPSFRDLAGKIIGSVTGDGFPADLSARKKYYLRVSGYGKNRARR